MNTEPRFAVVGQAVVVVGNLRCTVFGHRLVTRHHSAGYTTHCSRCKLSETVRNYS